MVTKLEVLRDLSATLGFDRNIEQVPAEYDCPVHETPTIEHHVETISGWQAVLSCPAYDGSCRYDPNADPMQIEQPAGKHGKDDKDSGDAEAKAVSSRPPKPANQGGF